MKVEISRFDPNPYDKGEIDAEHVKDLQTSDEGIGGLDKIVVKGRSHPTIPGRYQMIDGKHRKQAIINRYGKTALVEYQPVNILEEQWIQALVKLNVVRRKVPRQELVSICEQASDFLSTHPKACKCREKLESRPNSAETSKDSNHELGGVNCVARFLGLDHRRVSEYLGNSQPRTQTTSGGDIDSSNILILEELHAATQTPILTTPAEATADLHDLLSTPPLSPPAVSTPQGESPVTTAEQDAEIAALVAEDEKKKARDEKPKTPKPDPVEYIPTDEERSLAIKASLSRVMSNHVDQRGATRVLFIKATEAFLDELHSG